MQYIDQYIHTICWVTYCMSIDIIYLIEIHTSKHMLADFISIEILYRNRHTCRLTYCMSINIIVIKKLCWSVDVPSDTLQVHWNLLSIGMTIKEYSIDYWSYDNRHTVWAQQPNDLILQYVDRHAVHWLIHTHHLSSDILYVDRHYIFDWDTYIKTYMLADIISIEM